MAKRAFGSSRRTDMTDIRLDKVEYDFVRCPICHKMNKRFLIGHYPSGSQKWADENGRYFSGKYCPKCNSERIVYYLNKKRIENKLNIPLCERKHITRKHRRDFLMARFSESSQKKLLECHEDIQKVLIEAIQKTDFTVVCGHRTKEDQDRAVAEKKSKTVYPNSKHNSSPSQAVDLAPYPIDWDDADRFKELAKIILKCAIDAGVNMRWGGDWNCNGRTDDEKFIDMPHFELMGE